MNQSLPTRTAWRKLVAGGVTAGVWSVLLAANHAEGGLRLACVPMLLLGLFQVAWGVLLLRAPSRAQPAS